MTKIFIERGEDGKYRATKEGAERASIVADTQNEVIDECRRMYPELHPDVERQRDTERGSRDKWRKS